MPRALVACSATSGTKARPSSSWAASQAGMRRVRRRYSERSASAKCSSSAPYSSTVPGQLRQSVDSGARSASMAAMETTPSAWLTRCRVTKVASTSPEAMRTRLSSTAVPLRGCHRLRRGQCPGARRASYRSAAAGRGGGCGDRSSRAGRRSHDRRPMSLKSSAERPQSWARLPGTAQPGTGGRGHGHHEPTSVGDQFRVTGEWERCLQESGEGPEARGSPNASAA